MSNLRFLSLNVLYSMDILFAILAVLGFVSGLSALLLAAYSHISNRARVEIEMSNARTDALGIEARIEGALNRKLDKALLDMRQAVQGDAIEVVQNILPSQPGQGNPLDIANFNHFGD